MSLRKRFKEAKEKNPEADISIRRNILYIDGIPEEEFVVRSLSSLYFLPGKMSSSSLMHWESFLN